MTMPAAADCRWFRQSSMVTYACSFYATASGSPPRRSFSTPPTQLSAVTSQPRAFLTGHARRIGMLRARGHGRDCGPGCGCGRRPEPEACWRSATRGARHVGVTAPHCAASSVAQRDPAAAAAQHLRAAGCDVAADRGTVALGSADGVASGPPTR